MTDEPIISTKDRPGSYDAIETAKPGEPLFPIQGGDPFGPPTVLHWASLARAAGLAEADEAKAERLLRKATDAEHVAWIMQAYQDGHAEPENKRATYNDAPQIEVDESAGHERAVREARIKGVERLNNIVAMATDIAEAIAKLDACPDELTVLRQAIGLIEYVGRGIEPRRGNERT